jgi:hypothetical protein
MYNLHFTYAKAISGKKDCKSAFNLIFDLGV